MASLSLKTISVSEAANAVNLPRAAIVRLLKSGAIRGGMNGRDYRVNEESLRKWATQRQITSPIAVPDRDDPENPFV